MLSVNRQELKFFMTKADSISLQRQLSAVLSPDVFAKKGYYRVRSLYYDSLENIDFYEKLCGEKKRKKVRMRVYGKDPDTIKLELKDKDGPYQQKLSLLLSRAEADAMLRSDYRFLLEREEEHAKLIYIIVTQGAYCPAVIVEYYRRAFVYPDFDTRITFDENIRSCDGHQDFFAKELPFMPGYKDGVILEVKYNGILIHSIQKILEEYLLFQVSASKYSIARGGE
ncbi:MAG: polyphosphate polymerase domain-containing protein [Lachnospiraceae bacterium]|nr:polyphosphate polymerase domain-containing protein [Lachnospiraceae bacterium]